MYSEELDSLYPSFNVSFKRHEGLFIASSGTLNVIVPNAPGAALNEAVPLMQVDSTVTAMLWFSSSCYVMAISFKSMV